MKGSSPIHGIPNSTSSSTDIDTPLWPGERRGGRVATRRRGAPFGRPHRYPCSLMPCSACGHENPPGTKFCGECGRVMSSPPPSGPTKAERRIVSVLFADLVGFTPFSESRDSEEVREMLTTYFERSREIVERFAGTVDKFIGDAVMAWWGAVEAREDDAERAVRAALELVAMVADLGTEMGVPD